MIFQYGQTLMCKKHIERASKIELTKFKMELTLDQESISDLRYIVLVPSAVDTITTEIVLSVDGKKVFTMPITSTEIQAIGVHADWFTKSDVLEIETLESSETWQISVLALFSETEIDAPDFKDISTLYNIAGVFFEKRLILELEQLVSISSKIDSSSAEKYLIEAFLYEEQNADRKAFESYQKAFKVESDHNVARRLYGFWLARNGEFDEAKTILSPLLKKSIDDFETVLAWQHYLVILICENMIPQMLGHLKGIDAKEGQYAYHFLYIWKMILEFVTKGDSTLRPENNNQLILLRDIATFSVLFAEGARSLAKGDLDKAFSGLAVMCCKLGGSYLQNDCWNLLRRLVR